jgi:hypothetical protein
MGHPSIFTHAGSTSHLDFCLHTKGQQHVIFSRFSHYMLKCTRLHVFEDAFVLEKVIKTRIYMLVLLFEGQTGLDMFMCQSFSTYTIDFDRLSS